MTKSKILQNEIDIAIDKIKLLTENDRNEVHNLFLKIYNNFLNLPEDEFINEIYYNQYKKIIKNSSSTFEEELASLLKNDDNTNTYDNYLNIKASILMMSPEKLCK